MTDDNYARFQNLVYEDFRKMAGDNALTPFEKIGFPNSYRQGAESSIFADICGKLPLLAQKSRNVLDIGPGCSGLPRMLVDLCEKNGHTLFLVDSPEMLNMLPDAPFISKIPGRYPKETKEFIATYKSSIDAIICYSVLHYIFVEDNVFNFIDTSLELLASGGMMLIGDIPNISKRKRFFHSAAGIKFHQEFTGTGENPIVNFNRLEAGAIDDGVLLGIVARCRNAGFDAYLVPQSQALPMANRREDLLIIKP